MIGVDKEGEEQEEEKEDKDKFDREEGRKLCSCFKSALRSQQNTTPASKKNKKTKQTNPKSKAECVPVELF